MAKLTRTFATGNDAINRAGGPAFSLPLKERFATRLMTCLVGEPKFYGDTTQELVDETKELCSQDPWFVMQAAIYARETMYLRTAPLILLRWLAPHISSKDMSLGIQRICTRPDQLADLHGYYKATQETKTLSKGMKLGIRETLASYSTYQLAKYPHGLVPLIKTTHPGPRREEYQKLIENKLEAPYTWEVELTRNGNNAETWDALLSKDAVPYMALLRNLRNILKSESNQIGVVCERLADPERIKRSKLYPFRFLAAHKALTNEKDLTRGEPYQRVLEALSQAFISSSVNLPQFEGRTIFLVDHSGSMSGRLSQRGSVSYRDTADTLTLLGAGMCESFLPVAFATHAAIMEFPANPSLDAISGMGDNSLGGGTSLAAGFALLEKAQASADRVIILSDTQAWQTYRGEQGQGAATKWRDSCAPESWIHSIDLAGYGTTQLRDDRVSVISGWSEKVLGLIPLIEQGTDGFIQAIEAVSLTMSDAVVAEESDDDPS